jgi:uncharacterized protein YjiS (DUF1127 family)
MTTRKEHGRASRRAERHLMEMPDHLPKDIGIARSDIRRAVRQGWS